MIMTIMMQLPIMLCMESFLHFHVTVAIIVILPILIMLYSPLVPTNIWSSSTNTFCWKKKRTFNNKSTRGQLPAPQPAGAWPIIGHLHLLTNPNMCVYQILSAMADKYGHTFSLRLGFHQSTLVVNSWQVAKECFTANDITFSTRPNSLAMNIMAYNHSMIGAAPYGRYWRALRKFIVLHLLSNQRLQMLKHVRFSEIDLFTKGLYRLWDENGGDTVLVNVDDKFADMTTNIITRIIAGKRYAGGINTEESRRFQKAFGEFSHLSGLFIVSDAIPFLWVLDMLNGNYAKMKRVAKEVDNVFSKWVDEHREKRLGGCIKEEEMDLIHVMLSHLQVDGDLANTGYDDDTIIKSTCMGLVLGGNDTTSITMTWALSLLLNNRDALHRAQEELDTHVGRHRLVEESDVKKLIYLQAIFKETMRLQPASPLLAPRQAMEDCSVAGHHIPAGTRLLVNVWKMHRDPSVWAEPLAFRPERFLMVKQNVDVIGKSFELLPFGGGRRMCPGITFSQQIMHLGLARILQVFEMDTVGGLQVDMTEIPGLTVKKSTPLKLLLRPRVSAQLINNLV